MGFSIGGIASPVPVKIYGWVGVIHGTGGATDTCTITKGGFSATDMIKITVIGYMSSVANPAHISITVNDGSAHTLVCANHGAGGAETFDTITYFCKSGYQNAMRAGAVSERNTATDAISIADIASFTVSAISDGNAESYVYGVSVEALATP